MRTLLLAMGLALVAGAAFAASPPYHLSRAQALLRSNPPQLKEAIAEARLSIAQELADNPQDVAGAWAFIGSLYQRLGQPAQAEQAYRKAWPALRDTERGRYAGLQLARLFAARKEYDRALALCSEVLPLMKNEVELHNFSNTRLSICLAAGRREQAVRQFEWAAWRKLDSAMTSHACSIISRLAETKPPDSAQLVDRMFARLPAKAVTPLLFAVRARFDRAIGRPAAALKWLEPALANAKQRDSWLSDAHFEAGLTYESLKDAAAANKHFNQVLALAETGDPYAKALVDFSRLHIAYCNRGMTGVKPGVPPAPGSNPLAAGGAKVQ